MIKSEQITLDPWDRLFAAKKRTNKVRAWHRWDKLLLPYTARVESVFRKFFNAERKAFLLVISRLTLKSESITETEGSLEVIQRFIIKDHIKQLKQSLLDAGEEIAFAEIAALTFHFTGLPASVKTWLDSYEPKIVDDIGSTNIKLIMQDIHEGIAKGESLPQIEDRINQTYSDWNRSRVPFIARTETLRIASMSQQAILQEGTKLLNDNEVIVQTWLNSQDERVRDSHLDETEGGVGGEERELGEAFSNGLLFPRDPDGPPEETINCRCSLLAEVRQLKE